MAPKRQPMTQITQTMRVKTSPMMSLKTILMTTPKTRKPPLPTRMVTHPPIPAKTAPSAAAAAVVAAARRKLSRVRQPVPSAAS